MDQAKGRTVTGTTTLTGALSAKGGAVFNESGADVDFRVESDTLTHALFVRGSDGSVGMGTDSPDEQLHIKASSTSSGGGNSILRLHDYRTDSFADGDGPSIKFSGGDLRNTKSGC